MRRHIIRGLLEDENANELDITYEDIMSLSVMQLREHIERKKQEKKMYDAACKIQRCFKKFLFRKLLNFKYYYQNKQARRLQAQWKVHRRRKFRDGLANYGRIQAVMKIQKFLKGYIVSKHLESTKIHRRLYKNIEFFE